MSSSVVVVVCRRVQPKLEMSQFGFNERLCGPPQGACDNGPMSKETNLVVLRSKMSSDDFINKDFMSDDEEVAVYVRRGYCFILSLLLDKCACWPNLQLVER